ncbi:MAG: cytochrome c oxidase subunit [Mycobacterium sp.]|nr:cytochrome c oxidase subunit [Mycobacterium sp.]
MLFSVGLLVTFLLGGLSGVLLASPPIDFHVTDTYFLVAHFHYVLFGTIVFAGFAGVYFWFPKMTGRLLDERLGKLHFWLTLIGFHTTFLVQHWLGNMGMPRRYADYLPTDGFTTLNTVSTVGASPPTHPERGVFGASGSFAGSRYGTRAPAVTTFAKWNAIVAARMRSPVAFQSGDSSLRFDPNVRGIKVRT